MSSDPSGLLDNPAHLLALARKLAETGRSDMLAGLVRQLADRGGDDPLLGAIAARIAFMGVPRFHSAMLRDVARNSFYRRAIEAEAPGKVVLDIGTGSGLLAMMAARAGAVHVYACEADHRLAATAREIVARNGLSERITVIAGNSSGLDAQRDLGGGVDLVVSEVFSSDLVTEGLLPSLRDASERLCKPGARFLPARASVRAALYDWLGDDEGLAGVEGFDLSPLARHAEQDQRCKAEDPRLVLRSAPVDLLAAHFPGDHPAELREDRVVASLGGRVCGVVQWIAFADAAGNTYENAPGDAAHWALHRYPLDCPVASAAGDDWTIGAWRDEQTVLCWASPA